MSTSCHIGPLVGRWICDLETGGEWQHMAFRSPGICWCVIQEVQSSGCGHVFSVTWSGQLMMQFIFLKTSSMWLCSTDDKAGLSGRECTQQWLYSGWSAAGTFLWTSVERDGYTEGGGRLGLSSPGLVGRVTCGSYDWDTKQLSVIACPPPANTHSPTPWVMVCGQISRCWPFKYALLNWVYPSNPHSHVLVAEFL